MFVKTKNGLTYAENVLTREMWGNDAFDAVNLGYLAQRNSREILENKLAGGGFYLLSTTGLTWLAGWAARHIHAKTIGHAEQQYAGKQ